ncbi:hypothetical protein SFB93_09215 [Kurthia gibsonii]|uniref:hypothetical protein n=1 Tax=Kurthia gibsonii TaxID=33946 RepID=UPI002D6E50F2|nr:hypothetical protein [Kurthia gibsonii]MEB6113200.1 hypothetical protein [Kurthia gibsonii]HZG11380.1 hypothetical protein [Kurthia gibsonii]
MDEETWLEVQQAIDEGQELSFDYRGEEWWISRIDDERSFLLTRSSDDLTQYFKTAEELYEKGMIDGKPFIERIAEL